jgi:hypothetical protein
MAQKSMPTERIARIRAGFMTMTMMAREPVAELVVGVPGLSSW